MNLLVSACLLGMDCRYCGTGAYHEQVSNLMKEHNLIPVCPEQSGGLSTPRNPVELKGGLAVDKEGRDYTSQFQKGAEETLKLGRLFQCQGAILKSNSPSCGCGRIYDGTFQGKLIAGNGITAEKLMQNGIRVITEKDLAENENIVQRLEEGFRFEE